MERDLEGADQNEPQAAHSSLGEHGVDTLLAGSDLMKEAAVYRNIASDLPDFTALRTCTRSSDISEGCPSQDLASPFNRVGEHQHFGGTVKMEAVSLCEVSAHIHDRTAVTG